MRIGIIGAHGTGKTTLAAQMFAHASKTARKAKLIHEVARRCPLPLNEKFTIEAATWIVAKHTSLEIEAGLRGDGFVICDRSCFDPVVYAINTIPDDMRSKRHYRTSALYKFAEYGLRMYDTIIYIKPVNHEIAGDGIRCVDPEFQKSISEIFETELRHMDYNFIHYREQRMLPMHYTYVYMNANEVFENDNTEFFESILKNECEFSNAPSNRFLEFSPYAK